MRNGSATALLREQHRLILRVVDAFERALADSALPPRPRLEAFITFFRLFTDACHHGGEEDVLFESMEEEGVGGGPIDALREEHRHGRTLVRALADDLARTDDAAFRERAEDYIDFIRTHIAREDEGLFDVADSVLEGPACARVCAAYETLCRRRFEGFSLEQLERLADELIDQFAPAPPAG